MILLFLTEPNFGAKISYEHFLFTGKWAGLGQVPARLELNSCLGEGTWGSSSRHRNFQISWPCDMDEQGKTDQRLPLMYLLLPCRTVLRSQGASLICLTIIFWCFIDLKLTHPSKQTYPMSLGTKIWPRVTLFQSPVLLPYSPSLSLSN
jgi:hypothetical protein